MDKLLPSSAAHYKLFNNISIRTKLAAYFGIVMFIFLSLVLFIQYKLATQEALENRIIKLRMPTNIAGHDLVIPTSIHAKNLSLFLLKCLKYAAQKSGIWQTICLVLKLPPEQLRH